MKYGYTDECQACTHLLSCMHNAKVHHDDRCRDRIGELMAVDDDQRQVERFSGPVHQEVEISRPAAGEEVDVGEPSVRVAGSVEEYSQYWSDEMWKSKMAGGGGNKKKFQDCTDSSGQEIHYL